MEKKLVSKLLLIPFSVSVLSFALAFLIELPQSLETRFVESLKVSILVFLIFLIITLLTHIIILLSSESLDLLSSQLKHRISMKYGNVYEDYFKKQVDDVIDAVNDEKFTIYEFNQFNEFYKKILIEYPKSTFIASSLLHPDYVWKKTIEPNSLEEAIKDFCSNGGVFERVFIYDPSDVKVTEEFRRNIYKNQREMGVKVYEVNINSLPTNLHRFILASENKKTAWEVFPFGTKSFHRAVITAKKQDIINHYKDITMLKNKSIPVDLNTL